MTTNRTYDPGPEMPLASDPASVSKPMLDARHRLAAEEDNYSFVDMNEHARRVLVRCPLPNIIAERHRATRNLLERRLCGAFGGFTSYAMTGGWRDDNGRLMFESGLVYEVSVTDQAKEARDMFCDAGRELGEIDVHVTLSDHYAAHTRVNPHT